MKIWIHGRAPNCAINLEAETQAERDQLARVKEEAKTSKADLVGLLYDPKDSLRIRLETKP